MADNEPVASRNNGQSMMSSPAFPLGAILTDPSDPHQPEWADTHFGKLANG